MIKSGSHNCKFDLPKVNTSVKLFFVATFESHRRDDPEQLLDAGDRHTARLDARVKLSQMKRHKFLIDRLQSIEVGKDLAEAERNRLRDRYAELYWNAVGVPPDFHDELKNAMESIAEHGDRVVDEVMNELRHRVYSIPQLSAS